MSKVYFTLLCFTLLCFALLCFVIGPENLRLSLNQSDSKQKPITPAFSRALDSFVVWTLSSHWFLKVVSFILIGICEYLALVLGHSIPNGDFIVIP